MEKNILVFADSLWYPSTWSYVLCIYSCIRTKFHTDGSPPDKGQNTGLDGCSSNRKGKMLWFNSWENNHTSLRKSWWISSSASIALSRTLFDVALQHIGASSVMHVIRFMTEKYFINQGIFMSWPLGMLENFFFSRMYAWKLDEQLPTTCFSYAFCSFNFQYSSQWLLLYQKYIVQNHQ